MAEILNYKLIREVVRDVAEDWGLKNTAMIEAMPSEKIYDFEIECLERQIKNEKKYDNFVSDRTTIDYFIYASYFGTPLGNKGYYIFDYTNQYDFVFYLPVNENIILIDDGFRSVDKDMIFAVDENIRSIINQIPQGYVIHSETVGERVLEIMSILDMYI